MSGIDSPPSVTITKQVSPYRTLPSALGLSVSEILAEAEEWEADVIVLGTQGRKCLSRFMIGSVAESVSRKAQCDVLMIPAPANQPDHVNPASTRQ